MKILLFLLSFSCFAQSFDGDFRFRNEQTNNEVHSDRNRIRIRVNGRYNLKKDLAIKAQIATGESQTSSNQTLGEGKMNFRFQQLYVSKKKNNFNFLVGKLKNPFYRTNRSQIIWDNDLNPEGLALQYKLNNFQINTAYFDIYNHIKQVGIQSLYQNNLLKIGLSYHDFSSKNESFIFGEASGNSGVNYYIYDYKIASAFLEFNYQKQSLSLEAFHNQDSNQNAYRSSIKLGDLNFFMYSYQYSEADSTLGSLSESNIQGGQSDTKGHILRFRYYLEENTFITFNQYFSQSISQGKHFRRSQFDINFSF